MPVSKVPLPCSQLGFSCRRTACGARWSPPKGIVSVEKIRYRVGARDTSSQSIFGDFDALLLTDKGQCVAKLKDLTPGATYVVQVRTCHTSNQQCAPVSMPVGATNCGSHPAIP